MQNSIETFRCCNLAKDKTIITKETTVEIPVIPPSLFVPISSGSGQNESAANGNDGGNDIDANPSPANIRDGNGNDEVFNFDSTPSSPASNNSSSPTF